MEEQIPLVGNTIIEDGKEYIIQKVYEFRDFYDVRMVSKSNASEQGRKKIYKSK